MNRMRKRDLVRGLRLSNIRGRLILYFTLITMLMGFASVYSYYNTRMFLDRMDVLYNSNVVLDRIMETVDSVEDQLEKYLSTKNSSSLLEYYRYGNALRDMTGENQDAWFHGEASLVFRDIRSMIGVFLAESDAAISAKRGRSVEEYLAHYQESSKLAGYIDYDVNRLNADQFRQNTGQYITLTQRLNWVRFMTLALFLVSFVVSIVLFLIFSWRITKPIVDLSAAAAEISKGNFDIPPVHVESHDEIELLADTFNRMSRSIKDHVDEIRGKAEIEARLKEQEVQNLEMRSLLKEAELQALQSQINPHFIFNTLNAGAQIAMMEGADKTSEFMEKVAMLLRYNIRNLHSASCLKDEIDNAENYVFILKTRFADRFAFQLRISPEVTRTEMMQASMPRMILQPLLENAFIHGIGDVEPGVGDGESGSRIAIQVDRTNAGLRVVVEDNGRGMPPEVVERILADRPAEAAERSQATGHTTGIGMGNVIRRLRLFYSDPDILDIDSAPGRGTRIVFLIPQAFAGGETHV